MALYNSIGHLLGWIWLNPSIPDNHASGYASEVPFNDYQGARGLFPADQAGNPEE